MAEEWYGVGFLDVSGAGLGGVILSNLTVWAPNKSEEAFYEFCLLM